MMVHETTDGRHAYEFAYCCDVGLCDESEEDCVSEALLIVYEADPTGHFEVRKALSADDLQSALSGYVPAD